MESWLDESTAILVIAAIDEESIEEDGDLTSAITSIEAFVIHPYRSGSFLTVCFLERNSVSKDEMTDDGKIQKSKWESWKKKAADI